MMVEELEFEYKPSRVRIIAENLIAFLVIFLIIFGSNSSKNRDTPLIAQLIGAFAVLAPIFVHNTFLLKQAIKKQTWLRYVIKVTVYVALIVPTFYVIVSYVNEVLIKHKPYELTGKLYFFYLFFTVFSLLCGGGVYIMKYFFIERQLRLRAELLLKKKQISLIQSQINPHFLFNSLNSIKALTSSNPEKARHAIVQLSELLRKSLNTRTNSITNLEEELVTVNDYLQLEKMRYGNRLEYVFQVDVDAKHCTIPAMSLQLMVENAIKHGIDKQMYGGIIHINIRQEDDLMVVEVKNDGKINRNEDTTGIGTKNIIEQLKILYNNRASFKLNNGDNNTVVAQLIIPVNQGHE